MVDLRTGTLLDVVKIIVIVDTIMLAVVAGEKPIRTPTLIKKQYTGCTAKDDFKSDEEDCTIFHRCAYGYQYTYVCPPNNGFDSAQKVCNFMMYVPECQMLETALPPGIEDTSLVLPPKEPPPPPPPAPSPTPTRQQSSHRKKTQNQQQHSDSNTKNSNNNQSAQPNIGLVQVPIPTTTECTLTLSAFEKDIFCKSATFKLYYGPCCDE